MKKKQGEQADARQLTFPRAHSQSLCTMGVIVITRSQSITIKITKSSYLISNPNLITEVKVSLVEVAASIMEAAVAVATTMEAAVATTMEVVAITMEVVDTTTADRKSVV